MIIHTYEGTGFLLNAVQILANDPRTAYCTCLAISRTRTEAMTKQTLQKDFIKLLK